MSTSENIKFNPIDLIPFHLYMWWFCDSFLNRSPIFSTLTQSWFLQNIVQVQVLQWLKLILSLKCTNLSIVWCCIFTTTSQTLRRAFWFFFLHTMHWSSNGSFWSRLVHLLKFIFYIAALTLNKLSWVWRYGNPIVKYVWYHNCASRFCLCGCLFYTSAVDCNDI